MARNNNDGWCKTADFKKLVVSRNFTAFVISDELKYLVFENKPVLGGEDRHGNITGYGNYYDYFLSNGFRIKGIQLKNKHIEQKLDLGEVYGESKSKKKQEEFMNRMQLAKKGNAWMSTVTVVDKRVNFSDQMILIKSKQDIVSLQKALVNEKVGWALIKRIALEHVASGREILNILNEVQKLENVHTQQLYTSYIEKITGAIAGIDNYQPNQLSFLMEGDCHNIYDFCCKREIREKVLQSTSCQGQGLFFNEINGQ